MAHHFIDPNMGMFSSFPELSPADHVDSSNLNAHSLMGFSQDNFFTQFPGNLAEFFPDQKSMVISPASEPFNSASNDHIYNHQIKKRKDIDTPESSSANSSLPVSENGIKRRNNSGRGKKVKCNNKEEEKPKDVVHVRARRGQATDSHSLAERVRREKINDKLKCLQDIVPGCHKTMGMAVMFDEIINYVQSLQNQVEFLSMKLTAASSFYNFNSETDTIDSMERAKAYEAVKMQKVLREGCDGIASTQLGSIDLTFGCFPSFPYNT